MYQNSAVECYFQRRFYQSYSNEFFSIQHNNYELVTNLQWKEEQLALKGWGIHDEKPRGDYLLQD